MIAAVIVTVKVAGTGVQYDMELPADIPLKDLSPKLLVALKGLEGKLFLGVERIKVMFDAEGRYLKEKETLVDVGIWDGSMITVERMV